MPSFWRYFRRGMAVFGVLAVQVPEALKDGKLTIDEMADIFSAVCMAGGWKLDINIPDNIKGAVLAVTGEEDFEI